MIAFSHFSLNVVPWYTTGSKKIVSVSDISAVNFIASREVGWSKFTFREFEEIYHVCLVYFCPIGKNIIYA